LRRAKQKGGFMHARRTYLGFLRRLPLISTVGTDDDIRHEIRRTPRNYGPSAYATTYDAALRRVVMSILVELLGHNVLALRKIVPAYLAQHRVNSLMPDRQRRQRIPFRHGIPHLFRFVPNEIRSAFLLFVFG